IKHLEGDQDESQLYEGLTEEEREVKMTKELKANSKVQKHIRMLLKYLKQNDEEKRDYLIYCKKMGIDPRNLLDPQNQEHIYSSIAIVQNWINGNQTN